jgi:hypothetical protein
MRRCHAACRARLEQAARHRRVFLQARPAYALGPGAVTGGAGPARRAHLPRRPRRRAPGLHKEGRHGTRARARIEARAPSRPASLKARPAYSRAPARPGPGRAGRPGPTARPGPGRRRAPVSQGGRGVTPRGMARTAATWCATTPASLRAAEGDGFLARCSSRLRAAWSSPLRGPRKGHYSKSRSSGPARAVDRPPRGGSWTGSPHPTESERRARRDFRLVAAKGGARLHARQLHQVLLVNNAFSRLHAAPGFRRSHGLDGAPGGRTAHRARLTRPDRRRAARRPPGHAARARPGRRRLGSSCAAALSHRSTAWTTGPGTRPAKWA